MLTDEFKQSFFKENPTKHIYYDQSVEIARKLKTHSKGLRPDGLLKKSRPNEEQKFQDWRCERYTPYTKPFFKKIVTSSSKIEKAKDWGYTWPEGDEKNVKDFKKYITEDFPYFDSLDTWFSTIGLPTEFEDPNSVILVMPLAKEDPSNDREYYRPYPTVIPCENVYDIFENRFAVLVSEEKSFIEVNKQQVQEGRIYYFVDKNSIEIYVQIGKLEDWDFTNLNVSGNPMIYLFGFNYMPAFKIGAIISEFKNGNMLWESFASPCVDFFDEAVMDYSDHQVDKAIHLHPDRWEIQDTPCKKCNGTGKVTHANQKVECGTCHGLGNVSVKSPFGVKLINPVVKTSVDQSVNIPTPPQGYSERPIESIKLRLELVDKDIENAYSAINLDFLFQVPTVNSGVAKSYDMDGAYQFLGTVAKHSTQMVLKPVIFFCAMWRYGKDIGNEKAMKLIPQIANPIQFDAVIADMAADQAIKSKTGGLSDTITHSLEINYAKKTFGENSIQVKKLVVQSYIDPLPGKTVDEKMTILAAKGCTQEDYVLSSKIDAYTNRAAVENNGFFEMGYEEQMKIYLIYTKEDITKMPKPAPITDNNGVIV